MIRHIAGRREVVAGAELHQGYEFPAWLTRCPPSVVRALLEAFTSEEQKLLTPYFSNVDRPVFALVNLPEVVKGA